jgi:hypothetical protein
VITVSNLFHATSEFFIADDVATVVTLDDLISQLPSIKIYDEAEYDGGIEITLTGEAVELTLLHTAWDAAQGV